MDWVIPFGYSRPVRNFVQRGAMPDQFAICDIVLVRRSRGWTWRVCTSEESTLVSGRENSRAAARYKAARALFLILLAAPYRSTRLYASNRGPAAGAKGSPNSHRGKMAS